MKRWFIKGAKCILPVFLGMPIMTMHSQTGSQELISTLEVYTLQDSGRTVIYKEKGHFEAPNWSSDGAYFIINQEGNLCTISLDGREKTRIPIKGLDQMNNDHGISPDGTLLAISNNDPVPGIEGGTSRIYTVPIQGGLPECITPLMPSYWHGWSPDGQRLVYTAARDGIYNIYEIDIASKKEVQITRNPTLDDGPEYSPDGSNSFRSGTMEIWRMHCKSKNMEQLTDDPFSNWFPHPSPDGRYVVLLSYEEDQGQGHPPLKRVQLRILDLKTNQLKTVAKLLGGQGTINVPSWSPDSKAFAFVSYELK